MVYLFIFITISCVCFLMQKMCIYAVDCCIHCICRGVGWKHGKQVGSMDEESQVRGCYNITFYLHTNQETVSVGKDTSNKTFRT